MFTAHQYEQAIIFSRKAVEMYANFYQAHAHLWRAYLENGEYQRPWPKCRRQDDWMTTLRRYAVR